MKHILLTISLIFGATATSAGFINTKTAWDDLSNQAKQGYAMGAYDEHIMISTSDDNTLIKVKTHRHNCIVRMGFGSNDMVELINTVYRNDVSKWKLPPHTVMVQGLYELCGLP